MKGMGAIPGGFEANAEGALMIGGYDARWLVDKAKGRFRQVCVGV